MILQPNSLAISSVLSSLPPSQIIISAKSATESRHLLNVLSELKVNIGRTKVSKILHATLTGTCSKLLVYDFMANRAFRALFARSTLQLIRFPFLDMTHPRNLYSLTFSRF